jgi:hypothetical protein
MVNWPESSRIRCWADRRGRLAAILKAGRFRKQGEELRLYRAIAIMNRKAPVPRVANQTPTWAKAAALARSWQLKQLAERLEATAAGPLLRASPISWASALARTVVRGRQSPRFFSNPGE